MGIYNFQLFKKSFIRFPEFPGRHPPMGFEYLAKKFYIAVPNKLGYLTDFLIRIGKKPSALLHPLSLKVIYKRIACFLFKSAAHVRQAEIKLLADIIQSYRIHIILFDILLNPCAAAVFRKAMLGFAYLSKGVNDNFNKMAAQHLGIAGVFVFIFLIHAVYQI